MTVNPLPLSNTTHIGIVDGSGTRIVLIDELRSHLGVDALIRLHCNEFNLLPLSCRTLVHFNLEFTLNEVGRRYAVVPIVKAGERRSDGQEVLPIIDPACARRGVCTEVIQNLPIYQVTAEQFENSLPHIQTPSQLRAVLVDRYARMFPNLTDRELIDRGCAVTRISFEDWRAIFI